VAEVEEVEDAVGIDADGPAVDPRGARCGGGGGGRLLLAVAAVALERALLGIGDARTTRTSIRHRVILKRVAEGKGFRFDLGFFDRSRGT
jgi:hypothetical protein